MLKNQFSDGSKLFNHAAFLEILRHANIRWKHRKTVLEEMLSKLPLLLFGFGGKGQALARHIQDHTKKDLTIFDILPEKRALARSQGFKVLDATSDNLLSQFAVILGSCQMQLEQRESAGTNYIYYQEAACILGAPHLENMATDFQEYVITHANELFDVVQGMSPESRWNILSVLVFRLSLDPNDLRPNRKMNNLMWLDMTQQLRQRPYETFLDVGAFDGDTLRVFQQTFACNRGIAVEANSALFGDILTVSALYPGGIEILPMAAWSRRTRLNFEEVRFGMIKVTESEHGVLHAAPIDEFVSEKIDVLKMDIEGAEAKALEGCAQLLKKWKPDLAIAAYHRPDDFVSLYRHLGRYGYHDKDIEWHFAHYSDCLDDSILYAIRKS